MKKLSALSLLIVPCLFSFIDPGDGERQKSPATCYIAYAKPDKSVKKNEAKIDFFFYSDYYGTVKKPVVLSLNGKSDTVAVDSTGHMKMTVKPGKYKFQFWLDNEHYEIYSDSLDIKAGNITGINVFFQNSNYIIEADKPVIYFYPETKTDVIVKLNVNGELGFTYPKYNAGWNFTADTNGTLTAGGKQYDYLFWDAKIEVTNTFIHTPTGFIVDRDSLVPFFEAKLTAMNLSPREQQDFITYWCPLMQKNEKSYVRFVFNEAYDQFATMQITPQPANVFRVMMIWQDAANMHSVTIAPQEIPAAKRDGFTVIEWGGAEISAQSATNRAQ